MIFKNKCHPHSGSLEPVNLPASAGHFEAGHTAVCIF